MLNVICKDGHIILDFALKKNKHTLFHEASNLWVCLKKKIVCDTSIHIIKEI